MAFQTHLLDNGIRLIHKKIQSPVSHFGVFINVGSRDEIPTQHGMAHFIEHVIFKGTTNRKAHHILNNLDNVGGDINAYTTKEDTCIYASFLNAYYQRAAELLSDICFNSIFPEKELEKEKEVIFDEINQYKDSPSEQIFDDFEDIIFANHALGKGILGTKQVLKKINRSDVLNFVKTHYTAQNIVLSSVGQIDFNKLMRIIEKYFSKVQNDAVSHTRTPFINYTPIQKTVKKSIHQVHAVLGQPSFGYNAKEKTAMALLNNVLGGPGLNCRLNMNIREKYGFCYSIDSNYLPYTDTGIFTIYFATDANHVEKVEHLIFKELAKLRNNKLGTLQLLRAKNQLKGQLAIANESKLNEMLSIGKSCLVYNKVDSLDTVYKKIDALTSEHIIDVANQMLNEKNLSKLMYKNTK